MTARSTSRAPPAFADGIQALQPTGFQVGTNCQVNTNASTYYFAAFNDF